jgi:phage terminase small subunit
LSTNDTLPVAPSHLSKDACELFDTLVADYEFEPVELETLRMALEARDQAATARRKVNRDGQVLPDRFGQLKAHPSVTIHRDALATWAKLMKQLGLPVSDDAPPGRNMRGHFTGRGN